MSFYGDDFTGSTDVLEALTLGGVKTVLFLTPPSAEARAHFADVKASGIAGTGRSLSPEAMDEVLPPLFTELAALGAPIVHYKTCSTFDSSPQVGSIGRALDLGQDVFRSRFVPLVAGVPRFGRYCVFGNVFARAGVGSDGEPFRLDRHPTMRAHPVTPMDESDLRVHLGRQTTKRFALFDVLQYDLDEQGRSAQLDRLLEDAPDVVLFDLLTTDQLAMAGRLVWERASQQSPLFAIGGSGLEYALLAHWREIGLLEPETPPTPLERAPQVLVVSGSCSPVTERQILEAGASGYGVVALDTARLVASEDPATARASTIELASRHLADGRSVILHSCLGPQDPRIPATSEALAARGITSEGTRLQSARLLGSEIGETLRVLLEESGVRRVIVAGGDTSGYVAATLGIQALEMIAPLAPGGPLCRAYAPDSPFDGIEIAFKGGQVGRPDYFATALHGAGTAQAERRST